MSTQIADRRSQTPGASLSKVTAVALFAILLVGIVTICLQNSDDAAPTAAPSESPAAAPVQYARVTSTGNDAESEAGYLVGRILFQSGDRTREAAWTRSRELATAADGALQNVIVYVSDKRLPEIPMKPD